VRPTGSDRPVRWRGPVGVAIVAVAVVVVMLAVALAAALADDAAGPFPGLRTGRRNGDTAGRVLPPVGADVDGFERSGRLRSVGSLSWRTPSGGWLARGGLAQAAPSPGASAVAVVDPGTARVIVSSDVIDPVPGAGLVFRWRSPADHWGFLVNPAADGWILVRTVAGRSQVVGTVPARVTGANIGVRLDARTVRVAIGTQQRLAVSDPTLGDATAVGMTAPSSATRFDDFAVYKG